MCLMHVGGLHHSKCEISYYLFLCAYCSFSTNGSNCSPDLTAFARIENKVILCFNLSVNIPVDVILNATFLVLFMQTDDDRN